MSKPIFLIGCSDTGLGKWPNLEPQNQAYNSSSWELQQLLPNDVVKQCGEGGRSLAQGTDHPILDINWQPNQKIFKRVLEIFNNKSEWDKAFYNKIPYNSPTVCIHAWGINDFTTGIFDNTAVSKQTFVLSYKKYLAMFPNNVRHIVANVAPVAGNGHYDGDPAQGKVFPDIANQYIEKVWQECDVEKIYLDSVDPYTGTYDQIHHNTAGNKAIAKLYFNAIQKEPPGPDPDPGDNMIPKIKLEDDKLICEVVENATHYHWHSSKTQELTGNPYFKSGRIIDMPAGQKVDGNRIWIYCRLVNGTRTPDSVPIIYNNEEPPISDDKVWVYKGVLEKMKKNCEDTIFLIDQELNK